MARKLRCLARAQRDDRLAIVGRALDAAVPGLVVVVAVAVVLAVRLVVLVVVGDQVVQREAVVRGDEVDARVRPAAVVLRRDRELPVEAIARARRPSPSSPFQKSRTLSRYLPFHSVQSDREVADLVAAVADVPRLGDQLHLREHRILVDDVEERAEPVDVVQLARQRRREVEAEAVDVHLGAPSSAGSP